MHVTTAPGPLMNHSTPSAPAGIRQHDFGPDILIPHSIQCVLPSLCVLYCCLPLLYQRLRGYVNMIVVPLIFINSLSSAIGAVSLMTMPASLNLGVG